MQVDLRQSEVPLEAPARHHRRLSTYQGIARELATIAFSLAMWPVGLADEAVRLGVRRVRPPRPAKKKASRAARPGSDAAGMPIILIHGYFHNRSGFMVMQRAMRRRGFGNVFTFGYNPLRKGIPEIAEKVGCLVDEVLASTGAKKVHLVGHSLGGLLARYYVEHLGGADKTHTVVTLGTPHSGTLTAWAGRSVTAKQMRPGSDLIRRIAATPLPDSVRYFSYHSNLDVLVMPAESAILSGGNGNVRNILVYDLGHLSLLINQELIESIATSLSDLSTAPNRRSLRLLSP